MIWDEVLSWEKRVGGLVMLSFASPIAWAMQFANVLVGVVWCILIPQCEASSAHAYL